MKVTETVIKGSFLDRSLLDDVPDVHLRHVFTVGVCDLLLLLYRSS